MSGFAGIFNRDGQPIQAGLLESMAGSLRFRGPDGVGHWQQKDVGLGYALLRIDAAQQSQPEGLDGTLWIAGDIRLDARPELISSLAAAGERLPPGATDARLLLHAYRAWGTACLDRILGDYAFGLWDANKRQWFCARDPFGIKPFFYHLSPRHFIFSNTLQTLRRHSAVGGELDDLAILDFLAFGFYIDGDLTAFRDVRRLPKAHHLLVSADKATTAEYWTLPQDPTLRYRQPQDYVDQFKELFTRAVADRTGDGPIVTLLSGGLDSAAIAAALAGKLGRWRSSSPRAVCIDMNKIFADPEPALARVTANTLGIPLDLVAFEPAPPFRDSIPRWLTPEPDADCYPQNREHFLGVAAGHSRRILGGEGGDDILLADTVLDEVRRTGDLRHILDAINTWTRYRRPAFGLKSALSRALGRRPAPLPLVVPDWLNGELRSQYRLDERQQRIYASWNHNQPPARDAARRQLANPYLNNFFDIHDAARTGVNAEVLAPFLDLRVVRFGLSLPPYPWCVKKYLLRRVLADVLPETIAGRPKTLAAGDPLVVYAQTNPGWSAEVPEPSVDAGRWINMDMLRQAEGRLHRSDSPSNELWQQVRAKTLAPWISIQARQY